MERLTRARAGLLLALFVLIIGLFAVRLYDLQIIEADGTGDNVKTFTTITRVKAARGEILDCHGNKLVTNRASYDLVVNHFVLTSSANPNQTLKAIAEDIHARAAELGFDAFSAAGLEGSSSWRFSGHLANMPLYYEFRDDNVNAQPATIKGTYMANFKNIWDLYINNSAVAPNELSTATGDMSQAEFGTGKAVFWQQGTWEYANLIDAGKFGMNPEDLQMIPIYCGVDGEANAALCCGTENCWAVNSQASEEDIQATLDFMYWVVTDPEASAIAVGTFGTMPYKQAVASPNPFYGSANEYLAKGCGIMECVNGFQPNVDAYRATAVSALNAYNANPSDATWADVVTAFVDGWAAQYAKQNG